jgi:hypothetical protein
MRFGLLFTGMKNSVILNIVFNLTWKSCMRSTKHTYLLANALTLQEKLGQPSEAGKELGAYNISNDN